MKNISEMAKDTGSYNKGALNKELEYNKHYKDNNILKLVSDKLVKKMKIKKSDSVYFLLDKNDRYLGHIEYYKVKDKIIISHTNSELKSGFYDIMFTSILKDEKEIMSDKSLSTNSIKAYENLNRKTSNFNLKIFTGKEYLPFSKELLLKGNNVVSVFDKRGITEMFEDYYEKIKLYDRTNGNKIPMSFTTMFLSESEDIGTLLYCEGWNL